MNEERKGELFLLGYLPIFGFFPIITAYMTKIIPPLLVVAVSLLLGGSVLLLYLLVSKKLFLLKQIKPSIKIILATTLFNIIVPFVFVFVGSSLTSGINISLLSQTELLFTFLICGIFFHEEMTRKKTMGAALILTGTLAVLYNGSMHLNWGDIFIVIGQIFYPIGNRYSKIALSRMSPIVLLFIRNAIGGGVLLLLSSMFEAWSGYRPEISMGILVLLLFVNGIFIHGISKLLWFEGLKRLDITKAISIIIATPAFSFVYALLFLKEIPTMYQVSGLFVIMLGLFVLTRQKVSETIVEVT